jgi:wyosine [tRNA(Phe)-imidazoG37] synthetase (radical SAM superfamily)
MQVERRAFYEPQDILRDVQDKVEKAEERGETIDYLTFVPDGEPTLDVNLGHEIELLHSLGIKIAVITNSSLVGRPDARDDLLGADWVSLKMDSVQAETWHKVNRPHGSLRLDAILAGALDFATEFTGELATETMLVAGLNDGADRIGEVASFLARLEPDAAYLAIPTRPPAEEWVHAPCEEVINRAYQTFAESIDQVEYLIGYEGNAFAYTGNVEDDLLSITSVHPMREDAVEAFLGRAGAEWSAVHTLIEQERLIETEYEGRTFYMRKLR